ncbi:MAG TPA: YceI family protein [Gemmatimonadaceae bacterium]|nr:YceI family protein [Gemmatimonadaceae bacterium]
MLVRRSLRISVLTLLAVALAAARSAGAQSSHLLHLVLAPEGNEARYRVREQLATLDFPSDAVGKTTALKGQIVLGPDGKFTDSSKIVIDLSELATDSKTRDTYVRRHTLETETLPTMQFMPQSAIGLPAKLPVDGDLEFVLTGIMHLHGVTKPWTWQVKAHMLATGEITGTATTSFHFAEFNIAQPSVAHVLSVVDNITLEYDFHFVPAQANIAAEGK